MSIRLALIIGNTRYSDKHFLPLTTPAQDARDLAELLRDPGIGGFDEVTTLLDESNETVRRAIARFFSSRDREDLLLLYFSGHGVRSAQGELYLAQRDTEIDLLSATGVPANYITKSMDESRSRSQILILDCCFSGAFARNAKSAALETSLGTNESFSSGGSGHTVLTATDSLQYAFEGDRIVGQARNSVFTRYLVEGLRSGDADSDGDGRITVDELFDYAYENVQTHTPRQTPCKWSFQQQGDIVIARNPHTLAAGRDPNSALLTKMLPAQKAVACGLLLILNSLLAALGSLLWQHFPYWPAFMVYGLACIHLGAWGIVLAALTPLMSSVLGLGGAPPYLYIPVNVLQAVLLLAAFRYARIEPTLHTWPQRARYLALAVAAPSFIGGCCAWVLRNYFEAGAAYSSITPYALWWTAENTLPAIVPGIWLHQVMGELYSPFRWESAGGRPGSWRRRTFDYATPWMATLLLFAALIIGLISQQLRFEGRALQSRLSHAWAVSMWTSVYDITAGSVVLRCLVLALILAILYSLGSSVRFAKRTWILEMAVSRRLPFFFSPTPPSGREMVTVLFSNVLDFRELVIRMPPQRLARWLGMYFDCVSDVCSSRGGYIDSVVEGRVMVAFGLGDVDARAPEAVLCALDVLDNFSLLNKKLAREGYPPIRSGMGVHVGPIMATEIGSRHRQQFALLGETTCIAREMEERARDSPSDALPVILSYKAAVEAGLLVDEPQDGALFELSTDTTKVSRPRRAFAVRNAAAVRDLLALTLARAADDG